MFTIKQIQFKSVLKGVFNQTRYISIFAMADVQHIEKLKIDLAGPYAYFKAKDK